MRDALEGGTGLVLVDAHVHLYDCFEPAAFLAAAHANFRSHAERLGDPGGFVGLLLLSEARGCHWFERLLGEGAVRDAPVPGWTLERTREPCSLRARSGADRDLVLVAGHQIATAEGLEVLALGCQKRPAEGLPLAESLARAAELGAIPVVAWGAGKWLGRRGAVLRRWLEDAPTRGVFLGDNAGRLGLWPRPRPFQLAERRGIRILPGSDPLPFASHAWRAGSFGFWAVAPISPHRPCASLKRLLADPQFSPRPFGRPAGLAAFLRDQVAMQLRVRTRR